MDFITDLVKEQGITTMIFDMKNEMEYLENELYLKQIVMNSKIQELLNECNYIQEHLDITNHHIQNIIISFNIIAANHTEFDDIFEISINDVMDEDDFNLQTYYNFLTYRQNTLQDDIWYIENDNKIILENNIIFEEDDITNFNIDCDSNIVFIEYKEQEYEIEL